jgi:hypothetical protein
MVPPRNANGSKSKRKMKEVTVRITDKSDDTTSSNPKTSSATNGKVCDRLIDVFWDQHSKNLSTEEEPRARLFGKHI